VSARNSRDPLAEEFLRYLEVERNVSPRTLIAYRQALEDFRAQKDVHAWRSCRADDFRDYLFELSRRKIGRDFNDDWFSGGLIFFTDGVQQNRQRFSRLQRAQTGRIR